MEDKEFYWLKLARSKNIGSINFRNLISKFGDAKFALSELPKLIEHGVYKNVVIATDSEVKKEIKNLKNIGAYIIKSCDDNYPKYLKQIYDYPPVITVLGSLDLNRPSLAIVGSRNASLNYCNFAETLAKELGEYGFNIVSGLARGIDSFAHKGALNSGTIAVIAGGLDNIYPPENKYLYEKIAQVGAIISEMPYKNEALARHFPKRNRIICALSSGVIVICASLKSGSLITANMALEYNRELFAVPGFPLDPRCEGTNNLIKSGANMLTSIDDILENIILAVESLPKVKVSNTNEKESYFVKSPLVKEHAKIYEILGSEAIKIDDLVKMLDINPSEALILITDMELEGLIKRLPGNMLTANLQRQKRN